MSRKNSNGPIRSLCRACLGLVAAWWRAERVRISPREGELLRLQPGCLILIAGRPVQVLGRHQLMAESGHTVRYECRTEEGPAQLDVLFSENASRLDPVWSISGRIKPLQEHEIEVFG